jgi:hypothetical protein
VPELSKIGGDFRKLLFSYNTHYENTGLKENLEVELKCCNLDEKSNIYYPSQKRKIQPIISEYLQIINNEDIIKRFGINHFEIQTIDPKRTLCDKISRLTKLSYEIDFEMFIAKHIRDVYDIHCLSLSPQKKYFFKSKTLLIKTLTNVLQFKKFHLSLRPQKNNNINVKNR